MPEQQPSCRDCGDLMTPGLIIDHHRGTIYPTQWVPGTAENVSLLGIKGSNIDVSARPRLEVRTYRCPECGRLESYADQN